MDVSRDDALFTHYPPLSKHGVIGDRRAAALVAADGAINWLCLPDYDGAAVFGTLLDAEKGGYWRLGGAAVTLGQQSIVGATPLLTTTWQGDNWSLELLDFMPWPAKQRPANREYDRVVIRRLRAVKGSVSCAMSLALRPDFQQTGAWQVSQPGFVFSNSRGAASDDTAARFAFWSSFDTNVDKKGDLNATFELNEGEQVWAVFANNAQPTAWSSAKAQQALDETMEYWEKWVSAVVYNGSRKPQVQRSAVLLHLLSYAPSGTVIAAPTTSLPERIGGDRNYDYRFAWVRDASLTLALLADLGHIKEARQFMDWLVKLDSSTTEPLQVVYGVDGRLDLTEHERQDLAGYRGSSPVRFGNHAFEQKQLDSLGFMIDCVLTYHKRGGAWQAEYWSLVERCADYIALHWSEPDHGIWELGEMQHYVSSKVMSWVALHGAIKLAERLNQRGKVEYWRATMDQVHQDVLEKGWSDKIGAFRQRYEADTLDAANLLIPLVGFLPFDDPRVLATVQRIEEQLTIEGFVYRFKAGEAPGTKPTPLGEFEAAFLPCTFWLVCCYVNTGRQEQAEDLLTRVERLAGSLGLFAEEADPRNGLMLGNIPLLFAQTEYVRAVIEVSRGQSAGNPVREIS